MEVIAGKKDLGFSLSSEEKDVLLAELFKAGVHMGHQRAKSHPKMNSYVFATRHNIKMFDLNKTLDGIFHAAQFISSIFAIKGTILVVGTKPQSRDLVKEFAEKLGQPAVIQRWLGGTLTNFKTIRKRIDHYENLCKQRESGELEKYTKKEKLEFDKTIKDLEKKFEGTYSLKGMPNAMFIVDIKKHETAFNEAKRMKIPVIAVVDTDSNPKDVDYVIPANDDSRIAVKTILDLLARSIEQVKTPIVN